MAAVGITEVTILARRPRSCLRSPRLTRLAAQDNPSLATNPIQFEIVYECTQDLVHGARREGTGTAGFGARAAASPPRPLASRCARLSLCARTGCPCALERGDGGGCGGWAQLTVFGPGHDSRSRPSRLASPQTWSGRSPTSAPPPTAATTSSWSACWWAPCAPGRSASCCRRAFPAARRPLLPLSRRASPHQANPPNWEAIPQDDILVRPPSGPRHTLPPRAHEICAR